ncbi:protein RESPONSE TO ABA AND SALT 1-like [Amaranthus tricolor]|uniref:protein RESPONSE TO ABA AND SALT 1-like n=1 Tax=Amaranthus tricolor TaxID=29722 RepID=UPI0025833094|nr:protein RESPONSE TO ABA AND SALT 1-like [Amaranthus tricolor]
MPSGSPNSSNSLISSYSFEEFYHGWCHRQAQLSAEINAAVHGKSGDEGPVIEERAARLLIARVLGHFEEYYEHKSRAANLNGFALFSPTWCSSLECSFLWIAGFQPTVLLQVVSDSVRDLSPDQTLALERLKRETRINEKVVEDELARIQETVAAPPLMDVIRKAAWPAEMKTSNTESEPMEQLSRALETVIANADSLRVTTGAKVAEILTPYQCLRFLVPAIRLLQSLRISGRERDVLAGTGSDTT